MTATATYSPESIAMGAQIELSRRSLFWFCHYSYPKFYKPEREYLVDMCDRIQSFFDQNEKKFLVVNVPPRHGKSFTATGVTKWLFGKDPTRKVMTGSYNETLSSNFARQVRNSIDTKKVGKRMVYRDVFPETKIKNGEASAAMWALEGSEEKSYLATSPKGTATGFGANTLIVDDVIKNSDEAYNELVLDNHWDWFTNTMLSRLEGDDWKVVIIMTRWAKADLAGRVIDAYGDEVEVISYSAVQQDGSMLCDDILNKKNFDLKTREMNNDIVQANYNQQPIDVKGKLYPDFKTWSEYPVDKEGKPLDLVIKNYTDTADTGADYLCSINWFEHLGNVYITDLVYTDESMEYTETKVAELLYDGNVNRSTIESNNGGRGFARNITKLLKEVFNTTRIVITALVQTKNKESRILTSSAWVAEHVYMPHNWKNKYPEFYKEVTGYQKKGKNKHDDGVDVLASIYETETGKLKIEITSKSAMGLGGNRRTHRKKARSW